MNRNQSKSSKKISRCAVRWILSGCLLFLYGVLGILYLRQNRESVQTVQCIDIQNDNHEVKKVALTFDDGPHPVYTPQLLDGLLERNVKVTFFVTGENAEANPEIIKREAEEGHLIGNHTYSHLGLSSCNHEKFRDELVSTNSVIKGLTGQDVYFVRPPYGEWDKKFERELNMFPVLWDVDPLDWCTENVDGIVEKVVTSVEENDIILLHDLYGSSVDAALRIVDELTAEGYEFVTVDQSMFD